MLGVAVVGAGPWGINHVRVVATEPNAQLRCVADPDPAALERARAFGPSRLTRDTDDVLADGSVDLVVIASPASTHAAIATAALRAGKHVLIEKPLAMNVRDALTVADAARSSGRLAAIGHLMVHHPAVQRLKDVLASGALGQLQYLHSTRANLGRLRRDENALWSFGPHDLSIIDFLLGELPVSVAARGKAVLQRDIEDVVFMTLRYQSGVMAHLHMSWLHPRKERHLTLVCSQKMIEFDDVSTDKLRIYDKGYDHPPAFSEYAQYLTLRDGDVHIPQIAMDEPLRVQWRELLRCIQTGATPLASIDQGVRTIRILDAAQRSLALDGTPLALDASASI